MKRIISIILCALMLVGMLSVIPFSAFAATDITITSVDDWMEKLSGQSVGEANITVTATELDFTGKELAPAKDFKGSFNGNGVVIKNANIVNTGDEVGLFYCLDGAATFKNFSIVSSNFEGKKWVGAIACCICADVTVENVYIGEDVTIKAVEGTVGGIFGGCTGGSTLTANISNCVVGATIDGNSGKYVGGFVGNAQTTEKSSKLCIKDFNFTNCLMIGSVTSTGSDVSGFLGYNVKAKDGSYYGSANFINCVYAGKNFISYPFAKAGSVEAVNCYTTYVNADNRLYNEADTAITTESPEAATCGISVTPVSSFVGTNASVTLEGWTKRDGDIMVPTAIAGYATATVYSKSYTVTWLDDNGTVLATETYVASEMPTYKGQTPTKAEDDRFTYEFKTWTPTITKAFADATYTAAYSKVSKITGDTSNIWDEWDGTSNELYDLEGEGTAESPYIIRTAEQWANLAANGYAKLLPDGLHIKLEANLDFKGLPGLTQLATDGTHLLIYFDGGNHIMKGMNITGKDSTSIFGDIWGNQDLSQNQVSVIKNLVVQNSTFTSDSGWVSPIAGEISGPVVIENIYIDKTVTVDGGTKGKAGGIIGGCFFSASTKTDCNYTATIRNCVFAGTIITSGNGNGGIVGYNNCKNDGGYDEVINLVIENCLVLGILPVDAPDTNGFVGYSGEIGYASAGGVKPTIAITNCVFAGSATDGKYFNTYPFAKNSLLTLTNCYTITAGAEGAMYETESGVGTAGVTLIEGGRDALVGESVAITLEGWTKRAGDIMIPTALASFAPKFVSDVTVSWEVDGVIVLTETYKMGDMPEYKGEAPTKAEDDTYRYNFYGWDPMITVAMGDVTYVAQFQKIRKMSDNVTEETEPPVTQPAATDAPTTDATPNESGCGSVIGGGVIALVAVMGSALVIGAKKKEN